LGICNCQMNSVQYLEEGFSSQKQRQQQQQKQQLATVR